MTSVRNDIADLLEAAGITAVYSFHDQSPDECVALFPYSGEPGVYTKNRREPAFEKPRIQVVCRAADTDDGGSGEEIAEALANRAYRLLDGAHKELGYGMVRALQSPFRNPAGSDGEGRISWIFNLEIMK